MLRRVVAGLGVVAAAAGFRSDAFHAPPRRSVRTVARAPAPPPTQADVTPTTTVPVSLVAKAEVPSVAVYNDPGDAQPARTLENPDRHGVTRVFLVREERPDWLDVYLPVRPNGTTGWIRASDVSLSTHDFRIVVELGAHMITVWKGNSVFHQEPVAVGRRDAPTPGGIYYTTELDKGYPSSPYGVYAYGLSGFSDVLFNFNGEDGQIAIHGTNDPSSLGKDVSHGCIRLSNEGITKLAETLPLGVPVEIRA